MKRLNKALTVCIASTLFVGLTGCDLRLHKGEDINSTNDVEVEVIKKNLVYFKDQYGNCFAALNNSTDGFRSTFTLASVDCKNMNLQVLEVLK